MPESAENTDAICITGVGLAACLGLDDETVWQRVQRGACGVGPMTALEQPLPAGKDGGQAPELPADFHPDLPREARYLRWAIDGALRSAGIDLASVDAPRVSLVLGTTLHGMRAAGKFFRSNDFADLRTFLAGDTVALATRGLAIGGTRVTTCSACSSSLGAVALGVTLLNSGAADLVIAGGYDTISEYVYAGFNALRLISDAPLRPFTRGRTGMKVAEGYGIVILERLGARPPLAIVAGWGESADAFHLTRPHPEGVGALAAMRQAVDRAGIGPRDLGLIAAHATGTSDNDLAESAALLALLGDASRDVPVVGFKSHLGHTLGGAGAVELILSALAIRDGVVPPTANVEAASMEYAGLRVTSGAGERRVIRHTLNTSLGFGGANTCVVLRAPKCDLLSSVPGGEGGGTGARGLDRRTRSGIPTDFPRTPTLTPDHGGEAAGVVITGFGVLLPGAFGNDAFGQMLDEQRTTDRHTIDDAEFEHLLNARRTRRMSTYVKLSLCAATLACRHAGVADAPALLRDAGAILGTTHGSAGYSYDYYAQVVREGIDAANPVLFAEGVPNAAAAQLSLMLGLTGACQTIIGTRTAGLDALRLAALRISTGAAERIIVCAAEESHPVLDAAYAACSPDHASATCAGAVAVVLESANAAAHRRAAMLARIDGTTVASDLQGLRRKAPSRYSRVGDTFDLFSGDLFSVESLLSLAAHLIGQKSPQRSFSITATDRMGMSTSVAFSHATRSEPSVTARENSEVARATSPS